MKYELVCKKCGKSIGSFREWFANDQQCGCGSNHAEVVYRDADYSRLVKGDAEHTTSFYRYFDYLPLENRANVVTLNEGAIPLERWASLEAYAKETADVNCEVYVYRNDLNGGSGTFKDISASLAASVMKEHGVKHYCLASTGNAGVAYATYLAKAGVCCDVFAPSFIDEDSQSAIVKVGQPLHVSSGDYGKAKQEASQFHKDNNVMISAGNIDPLRIEAKRTMVFEFLRQLGAMPTVFMQAVAGGTGPIALEKGFRDIKPFFPDLKMPRVILAQQDTCDPMVSSWEKARKNGYPEGWEKVYDALPSTTTQISILTATNPGMYPLVAPIVKSSGGDFVRVSECDLPKEGREMLKTSQLLLGPASMVCYSGFKQAVRQGLIKNGDRVVLNTGESINRAQWFKRKVTESQSR